VSLIKGTFGEITPNFKNKISILHLDGDLYESYLTCLDNLYDNVVEGGTIIFDEYYSHKYPGARVAVDEFFENKKDEGYFEKYVTEEGHERWCFNKIKN
jgi:O-methyltransferase